MWEKGKGVGRISGDAGALPEGEVIHMTPGHTAFQVRSCGHELAGTGRSSGEGFGTARHEKPTVRSPCSLLTALCGAPRTQLLLSHQRLRIISKALELYAQCGRVSHSWSICVVGHFYGGLGVGRYGGGGWDACGTNPRGWSHVGRCRSTFRVRGDTPMTPDHSTFQARNPV